MPRKIYFGNFHLFVKAELKALKDEEPESYSIEWFLIRYIKRIVKESESSLEPWRIDRTIRQMVRFYLDNIDEKSPNGERCRRIHEEYRKTISSSKNKLN